MQGFGDGLLNVIVKNNVFNQISSYILLGCEVMKKDLLMQRKTIPNDENTIRSYLLEYYLDDNTFRRNNNMMMFRFEPEVVENFNKNLIKYEGRVDIKIVNQNDCFADRSAAYFVECKRLDGNKRLNKEYVENGIKRFVISPTHYHSYYKKNFMLGFLVKKIDIVSNTQKIEAIQQSDIEIKELTKMIQVNANDVGVYDCKYSIDGQEIELRHMFADLSCNLNKS